MIVAIVLSEEEVPDRCLLVGLKAWENDFRNTACVENKLSVEFQSAGDRLQELFIPLIFKVTEAVPETEYAIESLLPGEVKLSTHGALSLKMLGRDEPILQSSTETSSAIRISTPLRVWRK